jgi:hypothetical protein
MFEKCLTAVKKEKRHSNRSISIIIGMSITIVTSTIISNYYVTMIISMVTY